MFEILLIPAAIGVAGFLSPKLRMSDKKKIMKIFKNVGIGVKEDGEVRYPIPKKSFPIIDNHQRVGITYTFKAPLGLPANKLGQLEKNDGTFADGLGKPVEIEFKDGYIQIHVYERDIPKKWSLKEVPINKGWKVPLGKTYKGIIWHDFDKIPHMTAGGTTRYGKTVFLKMIITYLTLGNPDDVEFYIIDLKGGLEFHRYKNVQQVKMVATNPVEAADLLSLIIEDVRQQEVYFKKNYWNNIVDTPIRKRKFVIVDEGAQLAPEKHMSTEQKKLLSFCQYALSEISRIAGALGYRLIFCTQYPTSDTLPRQIKQNADGKLSFRLPSGYASEVAIDEYGAEKLSSGIPGRALYKTHELKEIQVPYISDQEMWELLSPFEKVKVVNYEEEVQHVDEHAEETHETRENLVKFE
jgi:DNA segregation ATPase FtsK/SpoIIIE, S-DNA-T family